MTEENTSPSSLHVANAQWLAHAMQRGLDGLKIIGLAIATPDDSARVKRSHILDAKRTMQHALECLLRAEVDVENIVAAELVERTEG